MSLPSIEVPAILPLPALEADLIDLIQVSLKDSPDVIILDFTQNTVIVHRKKVGTSNKIDASILPFLLSNHTLDMVEGEYLLENLPTLGRDRGEVLGIFLNPSLNLKVTWELPTFYSAIVNEDAAVLYINSGDDVKTLYSVILG